MPSRSNSTVVCTVSLFLALVGTSDPVPAASSGDEPPQETAADEESAEAPSEAEPDDGSRISVVWDDGVEIETRDGRHRIHIEGRAQLRYTTSESEEDTDPEDVLLDEEGFEVNRGRIKIGGHAYQPWLEFYLEYDVVDSRLLELRFSPQPWEHFGVRAGQYKVLYNRERIDSSGRQQFAERSIVNRTFTLDRQQGLTFLGRILARTRADSRYAVGIFTGTGRGGELDDDGRPMVTGRWQWNFLGRDLPFAQSDIARRPEAAGSLAVAAASNRGRFTRFSSSGGGQLFGFEAGESGQYDIDQWMTELSWMRRGLSIQSELHEKRVEDRVNRTETDFTGFYGQVGYFFHGLARWFPEPLELAARYARVDRERGVEGPAGDEWTVVANWFFHGHRNKLTVDLGLLGVREPRDLEDDALQVRVQWDVSF